jgi:hypothetical protein
LVIPAAKDTLAVEGMWAVKDTPAVSVIPDPLVILAVAEIQDMPAAWAIPAVWDILDQLVTLAVLVMLAVQVQTAQCQAHRDTLGPWGIPATEDTTAVWDTPAAEVIPDPLVILAVWETRDMWAVVALEVILGTLGPWGLVSTSRAV